MPRLSTDPGGRRTRRLAIAAVRSTMGASADLPHMLEGLTRPQFGALTLVHWHALTAIFAMLGLAMLLGARASPGAARATGWIAAAAFGSTCAIIMAVNAHAFGSPFANWPFAPLGAEALLCALAAWRA